MNRYQTTDELSFPRSHLLVAHGSKHGSTEEVAEAIAQRLRKRGLEVELRGASEVEDLTPYDGVVLGGALYFGRWHQDAARFLAKHRRELAEQPPAVFALGPMRADDHGLAESRVQLDKALAKIPEVKPRSIAVFGGVIDPAKLRFPLSRMPASDARDWNAIEEWADDVATKLEPRAVGVTEKPQRVAGDAARTSRDGTDGRHPGGAETAKKVEADRAGPDATEGESCARYSRSEE
jgi:menaquinone-dependent protoporphyrinogen oxidase